MGRLDDAAKRKVVELREAGLSFRKIKAVLELENIKVSAQAIYLFLKEFQGRSRQNDLSVSGNSGLSAVGSGSREMGLSEPKQGGWNEQQLRNLLREASSHAAGFTSSPDTSGQSGVASEPRGQSSGTGATSQERRQNDKKDEDVRIVSVTSLAQSSHHASIQTARSGAIAGTLARKRYTPSPANPVLVARKRLLDKALFHRARVRDSCPQSGQQTVSLLRRDQSTFLFSEGRKVMLPQTTSCTPTTTRPPHVRGQHPGTNLVRQGFQQRANLYSRSADQPQRVGIRLPAPGQSGAGGQSAGSTIRPRAPTGQPSPPCQQSCMDTGTLSSLQEHVKTLASEVQSISLALRMMVEQQGHLKREQSLQTQVQKQILSTLQKLTTQLEPTALQHCTTSTATSCPMSSASYNQSAMVTSQGGALCSQAQSRYNDINGAALDSIGPFSLDSLSSGAVTTFQSPESLPFTHIHTPPFTQSHTQAYTPEMLSYTQPQTDACPGMDSKPVEIASPNSNSSFQSCRSQGPCSTEPAPVGDAPLTIVKVESI